jgi:hypothetical protein
MSIARFFPRRQPASWILGWQKEVGDAIDDRELRIVAAIARGEAFPVVFLGMTEQEVSAASRTSATNWTV